MQYCINAEEIKTQIEKLGHTVTNIWNFKQYITKLLLSTFLFVELKPTLNNKDIFNENIYSASHSWVAPENVGTEIK
jgi:hypothetical protein